MFDDLAAGCPLGTDQPSSVHQKSIRTEQEAFPTDQIPAEEQALLIMRRLVRACLERRPTRCMFSRLHHGSDRFLLRSRT